VSRPASYSTGAFRAFDAGMPGMMPRSIMALRNPSVSSSSPEPVAFTVAEAPVCEQHCRFRDGGQKRPSTDGFRGLADRQKHPERWTLRVGQDMEFRVQAILRAPDQPSAPPFCTA
jgi:hypothetical protein